MSNLTYNPDNEFQTVTPGTFTTEQFSQMKGQQEPRMPHQTTT